MRAPLRALAPAVLLACAALLSGCITINVPDDLPTQAPLTAAPAPGAHTVDPSPGPDDDDPLEQDVLDCAGEPVQVQTGTGPQILQGDCPAVTIDGNDARVHLVDADVGSLVVRGDRLDIAVGNVGTLEIGGQDSQLVAVVIGAVVIRGDRNMVDVSDDVESATVNGNDNVVTARSIASIAVSGGGNQVGNR
jgi:hypothetical protein